MLWTKGISEGNFNLNFVDPYAPIPSASGFGVGFGYLNTF